MKNEPKIGRRPMKGGYYTFNLILKKNEPQIGRRPIKGDIIFAIKLNEK